MTANFLKTPRVVVIGAGPAGIAAATRLLEAGFNNIVVVEAENRIGGRIHSVPFGDNVVDLGAQWCHGEKNNIVYEMVKKLNLLDSTGTIYYDYKCVRSNRELLTEQVSEQLKSKVFKSIPETYDELDGYEGSLGTFATDKYWQELKKLPHINRRVAHEFFENFKKFESSIDGADHLFEVSGSGYLEYWLCEGDKLLNWKDKGFQTFLHLLTKGNPKCAEDLGVLKNRVLFNHRIEHIDWNDKQGIQLKCWNGKVISADHIICTVSLGVLKECHERMFKPPLPEVKCRAINGLKLGTVNKFFMEFEVPFGPAHWPAFCFLWLEEDLAELRNSEYFWLESVFGFYRVSYQPRVLAGWIIGPHARYMDSLTEKQVLDGLLWLFKKFLSFAIPEPINFIRTQWYSNPNFRGSYSFRSLYTEELRTGANDLASPISSESGKPLLQFAGEATNAHYYSTVHGAVESGWREAQRLISFYEGRKSQL